MSVSLRSSESCDPARPDRTGLGLPKPGPRKRYLVIRQGGQAPPPNATGFARRNCSEQNKIGPVLAQILPRSQPSDKTEFSSSRSTHILSLTFLPSLPTESDTMQETDDQCLHVPSALYNVLDSAPIVRAKL